MGELLDDRADASSRLGHFIGGTRKSEVRVGHITAFGSWHRIRAPGYARKLRPLGRLLPAVDEAIGELSARGGLRDVREVQRSVRRGQLK